VFNQLHAHLKRQQTPEVQILIEEDNGEMSIGEKRNKLLKMAKGDYVCFIDDDDWVDADYVSLILEAVETDPDCVGIIGIMSTNGNNQRRFEHSTQYVNYFTLNHIYCRPPNHLNPIRRTIAQLFQFKEINMGEDTDWAMRICRSQKIRSQVKIHKPIYHYRYSPK